MPSTKCSHPKPSANEAGGHRRMTVTVRITRQLRELSGGASEYKIDGETVAAVLAALDATPPGFSGRLFDDSGQLRRFVNVFAADEDIRFLDGVQTPVTDGQTLSIVPA